LGISPHRRSRAWRLTQDGQHAQALAVLEELIDRCGQTTEPRVSRLVSGVMTSRAVALWELGRGEEAVAALEDASARDRSGVPDRERSLAGEAARLLEASYLRQLGRFPDSIALCDEIVDRLTALETTPAQAAVAQAIELKCDALSAAGRFTEMLGAQDSLLDHFGNSSDPQLQSHVARMLGGKTWCLLRLGRSNDAISASDELLARFETESEPAAVLELANLIVKCSNSLLARNRGATKRQGLNVKLFTTAVVTARSAAGLEAAGMTVPVGLSRDDDAAASRDGGPAPGRLRAMIDQERGRAEQALKLSTAVVTRLASSGDPQLQKIVVEAQMDQIGACGALGRWPRVIATASNLISHGNVAAAALERRSERSRSDGSDVSAAGSLLAGALVIEEHGEPAQAIAAYNAFIDRYHAARSLWARALVWLARRFRNHAARAA
jgi:tetratricopeptide (TPR) repeat protein